jgi:hypothetical protein
LVRFRQGALDNQGVTIVAPFLFFRYKSSKLANMKSIISAFLILTFVACSTDRKRETISNYVKFIWRIKSDSRLELQALMETGTINGKDSLAIFVKQYSQGGKSIPSADSVIANYEKDEVYNSNLLSKTEAKIDSFKKIKVDNSFYLDYIKSLEQLRDFTAGQLVELRAEKYLLNKYRSDPDEILCHRILCRYKIKKEAPDTTSRTVTQIFYLSSDTRRVLAVKQDSSANKKPRP